MTIHHFFSYLLIALYITTAAEDSTKDCVYTLYVKTGSGIRAGTDSKIGITLGDATGRSVWVPNLEPWGLMGPSYDYFERDNLDIFSGRGRCIGAPICRLNLTSDGSGSHHGWYCDYVEVTSTKPHKRCSKTIFYVNQWLATDAPPYQLTTIIDGCNSGDGDAVPEQRTQTGTFVVGNKVKGSAFE